MMDSLFQLAFIGPGGPEFLVVMLVLLLMFGAKDAPRIFRKINEMINSVRNTADSFKREIMYSDMGNHTSSDPANMDEESYDHDDDYDYGDDYDYEDDYSDDGIDNPDDVDYSDETFKNLEKDLEEPVAESTAVKPVAEPEPAPEDAEEEDGDARKA